MLCFAVYLLNAAVTGPQRAGPSAALPDWGPRWTWDGRNGIQTLSNGNRSLGVWLDLSPLLVQGDDKIQTRRLQGGVAGWEAQVGNVPSHKKLIPEISTCLKNVQR